ncbi:MAG TPA: nitrogen fixation protein NifQ [Paraburkholderia sp.]|jgi:nitrogen fixation protein NifQ|nr:nitrogen fixation protein NifQ [Paraburkholderia sp.]
MTDDPLPPCTATSNPFASGAPASLDPCTRQWLAAATDASSPDTQLFARLIAARDPRGELALLGLDGAAWRGLLARRFAFAQALPAARGPLASSDPGPHAAFVQTLHALLLTYATSSVDADDAHCLATIITHACLRPDHLWRDLGLTGREEVTWMLTRYFPALVERNVAMLRWKKFLAQQLALSTGAEPGPAPGCPGCEDYGQCFPAQATVTFATRF